MSPWRNHGGSSLIEVMVSMIILAIGMMAGLGMSQAGSRGLDVGYRISRASGLAQAKIEEILASSYSELSQANSPEEDEVDGFNRIWSVLQDTPGPDYFTLLVRVEWMDSWDRIHPVEMVTVRSKGIVP